MAREERGKYPALLQVIPELRVLPAFVLDKQSRRVETVNVLDVLRDELRFVEKPQE